MEILLKYNAEATFPKNIFVKSKKIIHDKKIGNF